MRLPEGGDVSPDPSGRPSGTHKPETGRPLVLFTFFTLCVWTKWTLHVWTVWTVCIAFAWKVSVWGNYVLRLTPLYRTYVP